MSYVNIKSYANGLKILLDSNCAFEDIFNEIRMKFTQSKPFFENAKLAVTFEGRILSEIEEQTLVNEMENCSGVCILYVLGKDESTNKILTKEINNEYFSAYREKNFGKLYKGDIHKSESLEFSGGVVILGDIEPGAYVKAKGSIIVLGGIYGHVITQSEDSTDLFIASLDMSCEEMEINKFKYYPTEKPKWTIRPKYTPKIAYIKNLAVVVEPLTTENLKYLKENI